MIRVEGFPAPHGSADLRVDGGEAVRLIAPNGAGKTSLLRQLAGLPSHRRAARLTSSTILERSREIEPARLPPHQCAKHERGEARREEAEHEHGPAGIDVAQSRDRGRIQAPDRPDACRRDHDAGESTGDGHDQRLGHDRHEDRGSLRTKGRSHRQFATSS